MNKKHIIFLFLILVKFSFSQSFLNGSFECNTALTCDYNLTNGAFTTKVANTVAFGGGSELDIFQASCGYGTVQHGLWKVGVATPGGVSDAFTMMLSGPLIAGNSYTISFYDQANPTYLPGVPIQIGLSTIPGALGTFIYLGPVPTSAVWVNRVFSFIAPNNGQYISVSSPGPTRWTHVDNFTILGGTSTSSSLTASPSSTICLGASKTLTVSGGTTYTWNPSGSLSSGTGSNVIASPSVTTTYTVLSGVSSCSSTSTASAVITVSVVSALTLTASSSTSAICLGGSAILTVSGGSTYTWNPGSSLSSTSLSTVTATPTITTTYTVTGAIGTCTNNAVTTVSIITAPTLSIIPSSSICLGSSKTLTVSGATSYTWSPSVSLSASTGSNVTATPTITTTYTVIAAIGTCTNSAVTTLSVSAPPSLTITPSSSICVGSSATLIVSGSTNYTWSPGSSLSSVSLATVVASPTVTTNYLVIGGIGTCTSSITSTLSVVSGPTIVITPSVSGVCLGSSTNLVASGAITFTWNAASSLNTTIGASVIATPTTATSYTVVGSIGTCTSSAVASVSISPNPTLSVSASSLTICSGNTSSLSVTGASTYTWSPALTLSSSSGSLVIASPIATTNYSVVGQNAFGCLSSSVITITVDLVPTVIITPATSTICIGTSKTLTASGATTYLWNASPSLNTLIGAVVIATPTITENYTVTGTSGVCSKTATATVTVVSPLLITATASPTTICSSQSSTLTALGGVTYTWIPSVSIGSIKVVSPIVTTDYTVTSTDALGCISSTSVSVNVITTPTLVLTASSATICEGTTTTLQANGASNYLWSPSGSLSSATLSLVVASPIVSTLYTVIGNNGTCTDAKNIQVTVIPKIVPNIIANDTSVCLGKSIKLMATGGNTYLWSPALSLSSSTNPIVIAKPLITTIYTVSVSINYLCPQTKSILITVNPLPIVYAGKDSTINIDEAITLVGSGNGVFGYKPLNGEPLLCNYCTEITVAPKVSTCYQLHSINSFGCENTDDVCITVTNNYDVYIPNAFSPNGDSDNDLFLPVGYGIEGFDMNIFDRWGNLIFKSAADRKGWDGTIKGKVAEQGVYVYRILIKTIGGLEVVKVGHVTLLGKAK